ncbi:MAG: YitT family protein [Thermotogae bacterium]|nr:YitT family protein [Thermotogota bacterium]
MNIKDTKKWRTLEDVLFIFIGITLITVGLVSFLMPYHIAAGGANGMAIVLNKFISIPIGIWMLIINAVLFTIAFLTIGFDFSVKTIICTFALSFAVQIFDTIIPIPKYNGNDLMLAVIFGSLLTGIGMAFTFSANASTGGTDIIAKIMNNVRGYPMGKTLLVADFSIGIANVFSYGINIAMYSLLAIVINGLTIDFVMRGMDVSKEVLIISEKQEEISKMILKDLRRGVTQLEAIGSYTGKERPILMTIVRRRELMKLHRKIKDIDPSAFVIVSSVDEVFGEGFKIY